MNEVNALKLTTTHPLPMPPHLRNPSPRFSGLTLPEVKALNPGGFTNNFKLHLPSTSILQAGVSTLFPLLQKAKLIAEGDLHANTRKLLELLFLSNFIDGLPTPQAKKLFALASESEFLPLSNEADLAQFNRVYQEFKTALIGLKPTNDNRQILLIGDVISDRGADDRLTLALIQAINQQQPGKILTLAGNHDLNVVADPDRQIIPKQAKSGFPGMIENSGMMQAMYRAYLSQSQLLYYQPALKSLFSHSPITDDDIDLLFNTLKQRNLLPPTLQSQTQVTADTLGTFVDIVNRFFQDTLKVHFVNPEDPQTKTAMDVFMKFVWVRSDLSDKTDFPFRHIQGLKLIHGHDTDSRDKSPYSRDVKAKTLPSDASLSHSLVNLDNTYGKYSNSNQNERPLFIVPD